MQRTQQRILALLNIHAGESKLVGLVLAYAILLYASNVLARTASYALFMAAFDAETLPYTYIGISIAAPLISAIYLRLNRSFSLATVLIIVHAFLLLTLAAYALALNMRPLSWLVFSLPIFFGVNNSLTIASFWNLLGRIFNLQQGKRLFGLLSAGEHMATIVTGFVTPALIAVIGTSNLMWMGALLMGLTIIVLFAVIRQNADKMNDTESVEAAEEKTRSRGLFASSYVRLIIGLFALFIVGVYFVDNIFFSQAELRYTHEGDLASFIALFFGVFGVLSLFVQFFLAGRVLTRFGVRAMILATPLGLLAIMIPFVLVGTFTSWVVVLFWLIVTANMYRSVLDAVDSAAVNVMYQPLPASQRTQAQTVVIGVVYPLSIGVAGLVLLLFSELLGFTPVMLAYVLLAILGVWLRMAVRLGHAYPQQVQQAMKQRIFQRGREIKLDDAGLSIVRQGLASPHAAVVLYAIETLAAAAPDSLCAELPELIRHPLPEIRQVALQHAGQFHYADALPSIRRQLPVETSSQVKAALLEAISILDLTRAAEDILPFVDDPDPLVRRGALTVLLTHPDIEARQAAEQRLNALTQSSEPSERTIAAWVIGQTTHARFGHILLSLLEDQNREVQRAALATAGKTRFPELWPTVIAALGARETRRAATAALVEGKEAALPFLKEALEHNGLDPHVRVSLVHIAGRIGGHEAITLLMDHLDDPDEGVRNESIASLRRCGYRAESGQQPALRRRIRAEAECAAATIAQLVDLQKHERQDVLSLLFVALNSRLQRNEENIFSLLSCLFDRQAILRAWEILKSPTAAGEEQTAYALEIIDVMVPKEIKAYLLPLVSREAPAAIKTRLNPIFPQSSHPPHKRIVDLLDSPSPWLQLCAMYTIGLLKSDDDATVGRILAIAESKSPTPQARETAVWVLAQPSERLHIPLPTIAKAAILQRSSFFANMSENSLLDVASRMAEEHREAGEVIFSKGDEGQSLYIVVSGRVRIHDISLVLNYQEEADVFGELALIEPQPRSASATAEEATTLLRLERDSFEEILNDDPHVSRAIIHVLSRYLRASVASLRELRQLVAPGPAVYLAPLPEGWGDPAIRPFSPVERMMMLKRVDMFRLIPDDLLVQLVYLLRDEFVAVGKTIFEKGEPGDGLYLIAQGRVHIHDEGQTLNYLEAGQVFGEMALLDSEPRMASATAVTPAYLLRLDQAPFFELLEDQAEMAHGIIRILSERLRNRVRELSELKSALTAVPEHP